MSDNKRIDVIVGITKLAVTLLVACGLVVLIVMITSKEPMNAFYSFFIGPFTSIRRMGNIVEAATPLIFTALAVIMIFDAGLFSMITEGAFFIGILGAMMIGIAVPLPAGVHPAVCLIVAAGLGALAAAIPAFLKMKWNVSEVVTSLMLNYVVQYFCIYVVSYYFREMSSSSLASLALRKTASLPVLVPGTKIHLGTVLALLLCFFSYLILYRMKFGLKVRVIGDNQKFAHYAGIKVSIVMIVTQIIAGAIGGFGGGAELLGMYNRFKWTSTPGYGWTGIAVALLAGSNPLMVPLAALFIGYLNTGASIMARSSDVSSDVVEIIQGVIILMIATQALFAKWKQKMIARNAQKQERIQEGAHD
ncbi:MAG: ABC transporter permease [Clostridiales bacterium]|nr:ABC transporter permease [Clostridiales bacterium]